jgi:uncharacterized membrane protein
MVWNTVGHPLDPYPFTGLALMLSLEAIFLSILILISQSMAAVESERRHHLDLQINLLAEREMTAALRLLVKLADAQAIGDVAQQEVRAFAQPTDPASVFSQIVDAENRHSQNADSSSL